MRQTVDSGSLMEEEESLVVVLGSDLEGLEGGRGHL